MARAVVRAAFGGVVLAAALLSACVSPVAFAEAGIDEKDVVVLTESNFDKVVQETEHVLVEFYAPWCGHCKALAPEYAAAATALKATRPEVTLAKVDATVEDKLAQRQSIDGFPTLIWFVNGSRTDYTGGRDKADIVSWVTKKTGPPAETVSSKQALADAEAASDCLVVGFFAQFNEADAVYAAFKRVAASNDVASFVQTSDKAVAAAAGLSATGSVAVVTNFAGESRATTRYGGEMTDAALSDFVTVEQMPLTLAFNDANSDRIFSSGIDRHLLLIGSAAEIAGDSSAGGKAFREASAALRAEREFVFVTVDSSNPEAEPAVEFFGVAPGGPPTLVGFQMEPSQARFAYEGETLTKDGIVAFARGILDGTVKQAIKSAPEPESEYEDGVRVVVGSTFEQVVLDPTKDVLLEVYAPWCGHCKALAPIWAELATRFKDVHSIVVAKMDGTTNEHPAMPVEGFPTMKLFRAQADDEGLDINVRSLKDLTAFVLKHAKKAVKLGLSDEAMAKEDEASAAAAATRAAAGAVSEDDEDYDDELETDADAPDDEEEDTKTEL